MKNKILMLMLALSAMLILPNTAVFADEPFIKDFPSMEMSPIPEPPTPPEPPKPPETPKTPEEVFDALKQPQQSEKKPPIKIIAPPKQGENKAETTPRTDADVQTNVQNADLIQQGKLKEIPETGAYWDIF